MGRLADLLIAIKESVEWPRELTSAYTTTIPNAFRRTRPQDQRPITVWDVLFRVWAMGIVLMWSPVLHADYLGQAAMGFQAQAGILHLAQVLGDTIERQRRRGQPLWFVSFDVRPDSGLSSQPGPPVHPLRTLPQVGCGAARVSPGPRHLRGLRELCVRRGSARHVARGSVF